MIREKLHVKKSDHDNLHGWRLTSVCVDKLLTCYPQVIRYGNERVIGDGVISTKYYLFETSELSSMKLIKSLSEFTDHLSNCDGITVLQLSASWCGPCQNQTLNFQEYLKSESESLKNTYIFKADVEDVPDLLKSYSVKGVPTLLFFERDHFVKSITGLQSVGSIESVVTDLHLEFGV